MTHSRWKYDADKHEVVEQPTMDKPFDEEIANCYVANYKKHIASLRHIPVSGKPSWKHGDDITGKFTVRTTGHGTINGIMVADEIIQEQPQAEVASEKLAALHDAVDKLAAHMNKVNPRQEQPHTESENKLWKEVAQKVVEDSVFNQHNVSDTIRFLSEQFTIKRK